MTPNSERNSQFFVTARKGRLSTTDVTFSVVCELSQPISKIEFSSTIEQTLIGKKNFY